MNRALVVLLLVAAVGSALAHRLDECLQAIRVHVHPDHVTLSAQITPGMDILGAFLAVIDRDSDGSISDGEAARYARQWLRDLDVGLDGRTLKLHLGKIHVPPVSEMRKGTGVIQIHASAPSLPLPPGEHQLTLTNSHLPDLSVYLVNAVKPDDDRLTISKQTRNANQSGYCATFAVHTSGTP